MRKHRRDIQSAIASASRPGEVLSLVESAPLPLHRWDGVNLTSAVRRIARILTSNSGQVYRRQASVVLSDKRYAYLAHELSLRKSNLDSDGLDALAWAADRLGDNHSEFASFARECRQQAQQLRDRLAEADSALDILSSLDDLELGINDTTLARALHGISSRCTSRKEKLRILSKPQTRTIVDHVACNGHFFKAGSLVLAADSLSKLSATAPFSPIAENARTAGDALVERASFISQRFEPWHLPVLLAAIGRMRLDCRCRSLSRIANVSREYLRSLSGKEIAKVVGSFASIGSGFNPSDSFLHQALAAYLELPDNGVAVLPNATIRLVLSLRQLQYTPSETLMDRVTSCLSDALDQYSAADAGSVVFGMGDLGFKARTTQLADIFSDLAQGVEYFACVDAIAVAAALKTQSFEEERERGIRVQSDLKARLRNRLLESLRDSRDTLPDDPADLVMVPYAISFLADVLSYKQSDLIAAVLGPCIGRCKLSVQRSFLRAIVRHAGIEEGKARNYLNTQQQREQNAGIEISTAEPVAAG